MSISRKQCIIHVEGVSGKCFEIKDNSWQRIKEAASTRFRTQTYSKYSELSRNLPEHYDATKHFYHSVCYKNFTAIPKVKSDLDSSTAEHTLRSSFYSEQSSKKGISSSGLFKQKCLFCDKLRRKVKGKEEQLATCETRDSENNIRIAANILQDQKLLITICNVDFLAKGVCYHNSCRREYLNLANAKRIEMDKENQQIDNRNEYGNKKEKHDNAFTHTVAYVTQHIINPKKAQYLSVVRDRYKTFLADEGVTDSNYSAQKLHEKLKSTFDDKLCSIKVNNKDGIILHSNGLSSIEAVSLAKEHSSTIETKIEDVALYLRMLILNEAEGTKLNHPLSVEDITKGESKTPELLETFFRILFGGSSKNTKNERIERRVSSCAQDAIFITTNGRVKPKKHLILGLGIKSLTGSRKIIDIINHWGHCICYHTAEELETDLAVSLDKIGSIVPDNIKRLPGLVTGLAWDNFDSNIETLSGKGTLHDTFGICFQNKVSENLLQLDTSNIGNTVTKNTSTKRSRSYQCQFKTLEPYPKKPKLVNTLCSTVLEHPVTNVWEKALISDFLWMTSVDWAQNTPMWAGWNSRTIEDLSVIQELGYMENISLPPTRNDVVLETLKMSQKVAQECGDSCVIVHYDLAVAKPAILIQNLEKPRFDNVFVCFGSFHIELALFGAIGHFIEGSGIEVVLVESDTLAGGSITGFVKGKHFNRCKRIHVLLSLALERCHFKAFLNQYGDNCLVEKVRDFVIDINNDLTPNSLDQILESKEFSKLYKDYVEFTEKTRTGLHGKTAQFYMQYIDFVEMYKYFSRAYRTNDLNMYIDAIQKITPIFYVCSRPNYARWMTVYILNLLNIDSVCPGAKKALSEGGLSIKRTEIPFSRVPVDMALEQTVNADAASKLTGITAFANSDSARARWMKTRSQRSKIVTSLLEISGVCRKPDCKQDLQENRIKKDHKDVEAIMATLKSFSDPFEEMDTEIPFRNISNGSVVDDKVSRDLLSAYVKGTQVFDKFKTLYASDPKNVELPIPRKIIMNCASVCASKTIKGPDKKLHVIKCTRDLFARLINIASEQKCDMRDVLAHPLTPVPLALGQLDGSLNKTCKSKLMHKLEEFQTESINSAPTTIDIILFDAMFILHTIPFPDNYGSLANNIMKLICRGEASEIHLVFDVYDTPTIKDTEHDIRKANSNLIEIKVSGPEQKTPKKPSLALQSESFKMSLINFLCKEWRSSKYCPLLGTKTLYVGVEQTCYKYACIDAKMDVKEYKELACKHNEADTRIIWHITHTAEYNEGKNILVRANDSDILVLMIYHQKNLKNANLWLECGVCSNNSRRYINVTKITKEIGIEIADALPGFHAFTGSDYTAAFARQGKIKPFNLFMKSIAHQKALAKLGESVFVDTSLLSGAETFVCGMYGYPLYNSVTEVRYTIFKKKTSPLRTKQPLSKLRSVDPSLLPPSKAALEQKVKRSNAVSCIWKRANLSNPLENIDPTCHGWYLENDKYRVKWYEGSMSPNIIPPENNNSDSEDESVSSDSDTDSDE